jgi:hypothetical protein
MKTAKPPLVPGLVKTLALQGISFHDKRQGMQEQGRQAGIVYQWLKWLRLSVMPPTRIRLDSAVGAWPSSD